jgi:flagellar export protein FliJ
MQSRFPLATLLKLRESVRDERRRHLAEALRADELAQARIDELERELADLRQEFRTASEAGPLNVDRLLDAQRYELLLEFEQAMIEQKRAQVAEEIEKRRAALVLADRDVRALEILRERQVARARQEEQKAENRELDEVAGRIGRWEELP